MKRDRDDEEEALDVAPPPAGAGGPADLPRALTVLLHDISGSM